jgi:hypothetical protein
MENYRRDSGYPPTSTEPMFYTVSRTKSNTLRMEITLLLTFTVRSDCGLMDCGQRGSTVLVQVLRYIYPIDVTSNRRQYLIEDVLNGWVSVIFHQSVLIDDVPGEVVVLDDVIIEDPVDDYDYDYEFDFEKYAPGFEYDDSVEIFEMGRKRRVLRDGRIYWW